VFAQMFNQATSSAQTRLIDSGVFQEVAISYQPSRHVGPIVLTALTTPARLAAALGAIGLELAVLRDPDYFDEGDLTAVRKALRVGREIASERGTDAAHALADQWAREGGGGLADDQRGSEDVALEDIRTFLARYVIGRPKVVAVLATEQLRAPLTPVIGSIVAQWPGGP
jgi:hypothetical protein